MKGRLGTKLSFQSLPDPPQPPPQPQPPPPPCPTDSPDPPPGATKKRKRVGRKRGSRVSKPKRSAQSQVSWECSIIDEKVEKGKRFYLCQWVGKNPDTGEDWAPSWEPDHFVSAPAVDAWTFFKRTGRRRVSSEEIKEPEDEDSDNKNDKDKDKDEDEDEDQDLGAGGDGGSPPHKKARTSRNLRIVTRAARKIVPVGRSGVGAPAIGQSEAQPFCSSGTSGPDRSAAGSQPEDEEGRKSVDDSDQEIPDSEHFSDSLPSHLQVSQASADPIDVENTEDPGDDNHHQLDHPSVSPSPTSPSPDTHLQNQVTELPQDHVVGAPTVENRPVSEVALVTLEVATSHDQETPVSLPPNLRDTGKGPTPRESGGDHEIPSRQPSRQSDPHDWVSSLLSRFSSPNLSPIFMPNPSASSNSFRTLSDRSLPIVPRPSSPPTGGSMDGAPGSSGTLLAGEEPRLFMSPRTVVAHHSSLVESHTVVVPSSLRTPLRGATPLPLMERSESASPSVGAGGPRRSARERIMADLARHKAAVACHLAGSPLEAASKAALEAAAPEIVAEPVLTVVSLIDPVVPPQAVDPPPGTVDPPGTVNPFDLIDSSVEPEVQASLSSPVLGEGDVDVSEGNLLLPMDLGEDGVSVTSVQGSSVTIVQDSTVTIAQGEPPVPIVEDGFPVSIVEDESLVPIVEDESLVPIVEDESLVPMAEDGPSAPTESNTADADETRTAAPEYLVTLPMLTSLRARYHEVLAQGRPAMEAFSEFFEDIDEKQPDASTVAAFQQVLQDLLNLCDLPLYPEGSAGLDANARMKHASGSNSKFAFLHELLSRIRKIEADDRYGCSRLLIVSKPGLVFSFLEAVVAESGFRYSVVGRNDTDTGEETKRADQLLVTLATADQDLSSLSPPAYDMFIAFDDEAATMSPSKLPKNFRSDTTRLLLAIIASVEHVSHLLPLEASQFPDDLTRKNALGHATVAAKSYMTAPNQALHRPWEVAETVTQFFTVYGFGQTIEPLNDTSLPNDVFDFWNSPAAPPAPTGLRPDGEAGPLISRKRAATEGAMGSTPKRVRILDVTYDLSQPSLDPIEPATAHSAEEAADVDSEPDVDQLWARIKRLEKELDSHRQFYRRVQPKYMEALRDRGLWEHKHNKMVMQKEKTEKQLDEAKRRMAEQTVRLTEQRNEFDRILDDIVKLGQQPDQQAAAAAIQKAETLAAENEKLTKQLGSARSDEDYTRSRYGDELVRGRQLEAKIQALEAEISRRDSEALQQPVTRAEVAALTRQRDEALAVVRERELFIETRLREEPHAVTATPTAATAAAVASRTNSRSSRSSRRNSPHLGGPPLPPSSLSSTAANNPNMNPNSTPNNNQFLPMAMTTSITTGMMGTTSADVSSSSSSLSARQR